MSQEIAAVKCYRDYLQVLETEEFKRWFDPLFGRLAEFQDSDIAEEYCAQRRFALLGWLAGQLSQKHNPEEI